MFDQVSSQCSCPSGQKLDTTNQVCFQPGDNGINFGVPGAGPASPSPTPAPAPSPTPADNGDGGGGGGGGHDSCSGPASPEVADPINVAVGNLYEAEIDYTGKLGGQLPLRIERTYNSLSATRGVFGNSWSSNLDTQASLSGTGTALTVRLSNGQIIPFVLASGVWTSTSMLPVTLITNASGYLFKTYDKRQYQFDTAGHLLSLMTSSGEIQTYQYTSNRLTSVTDNVGNTLTITYNSYNWIDTISVAGQTFQYAYYLTSTDPLFGNLKSVTYPASSGTGTVTRQYLYENTQFPWALTGIIDETGKRVSTWGYNAQGLANSNNRAGSENFTIDYTHVADAGDPYSLVTNVKNYSWKYHLQTGSDGMVRVVRIEGLGSANCPAASNYTSYDNSQHPITVTDGNGRVTLRHYAINGQVDQLTEGYRWSSTPTGNVSDLVETANMRKRAITAWDATNTWPTSTTYSGKDANGNWINYQREDVIYDTLGHGRIQSRTLTDLTNLADPYNSNGQTRAWTYAYTYFDSAQTKINTLTVNGPGSANNQTVSTYDNQGRLTQVSRKASSSLVTTYGQFNAAGLPQQSTDPNGVVSQFSYDPRNRLKQVTTNPSASDAHTTKIDYYDNGLIKRVTLVKGGDGVSDTWLQYTYSDGVHLNRIDDNAGNYVVLTPSVLDGQWTKRQVYDNTGTLKQTQNRVFDEIGRLMQIVAADNTTVRSSYHYYGNGQLLNSLVATDTTKTTTNGLDYLNRLASILTPDGNSSQYNYDAQGNLAKVTDARGVITQYTYDGLGNLMRQQSPDSGTTKFWYDAAGNVIQKTDARGVVSTYTYDALNRLTGITYPANTSENVTFNYDDTATTYYRKGRLATVSTNNGGQALVFAYDPYGNIVLLADLTAQIWGISQYQYDSANRIKQITHPSGRIVLYTRNALGQITQVLTQDNASAAVQTLISNVTYEPFGPVKTITYGHGVTTTFQHDLDYRVGRVTTTSTPTWDYMYAYDTASNITSLTDQIGTANKTYGYDALNRVTTDNSTDVTNFSYQYDTGSNRTFLQVGPYSINQTYAATSNRPTQFGSTPISEDAAGNVTSSNGITRSYSNANRLSQIINGSVTTNYAYNGLGQRNTKIGAQTIHYDYTPDGKYLSQMQLNANGSYAQGADYIWLDDMPIAQIKTTYTANNTVSTRRLTYIHADHLNTPRLMTDSTKKVVWKWHGDAYGMVAPSTNPDGDSVIDTLDLRFPGQVADAETNLFYNVNRYYDPMTGRYTQYDPIGLDGGLNPYAYALDNPLRYTDPLGLSVDPFCDDNLRTCRLGCGKRPLLSGPCLIKCEEKYGALSECQPPPPPPPPPEQCPPEKKKDPAPDPLTPECTFERWKAGQC